MQKHNPPTLDAGKKPHARPRRDDAQARSLRFCILASLLVHLGLVVFLHESYLSCGLPSKTLEERRREELAKLAAPDYHWQQDRRPDARQSFETPVETKPLRENKTAESVEPRESKPAVPEKAKTAAAEPVEARPEAIKLKLRRDEAAEPKQTPRPIERRPAQARPVPDESIAMSPTARPAEPPRAEAPAAAIRPAAQPQPAAQRAPSLAAETKLSPRPSLRASAPRRAAVEPPTLAPSARTTASRPTIVLPGEAIAAEDSPAAPARQNAELPDESPAAAIAARHSTAGPSARRANEDLAASGLGGAVEIPRPSATRAAGPRIVESIGTPSLNNRLPAGAIGRADVSAGSLSDADALAADAPLDRADEIGKSGAAAELTGPTFERPVVSGVAPALPGGAGIASGQAADGGGARPFVENGPAGVGLPSRGRATLAGEVALSIPRRLSIERSGAGHGLDIDGAIIEPTEAYQHRTAGSRGKGLKDAGGNEGTEAAVERGLDFLARVQFPDGHWSLDQLPASVRMNDPALGTMQSDSAATGLALLTYLGGGYTHLDDKHREVVRRGVDWLARHQKPNGDLFSGGSQYTWFYSHGIAAIALCEAFGMTQDPVLRDPALRAVAFIVRTQHPTQGGWRYDVRPDTGQATETDTSVTGWQLMALKSAQMAGLNVPDEAFRKVGVWLDYAQSPTDAGRYAYNPFAADTDEQRHGREPSLSMTAEAMLMRMYLGGTRQDPRLIAGAEYLKNHLPETGMAARPTRDCYYWYYATQAMFQMQGDYWAAWNGRIRPLLQESQALSGAAAGSWHPREPVRDRWGEAGGRIYVTALHLLMLEVYYRHLPLFRLE